MQNQEGVRQHAVDGDGEQSDAMQVVNGGQDDGYDEVGMEEGGNHVRDGYIMPA